MWNNPKKDWKAGDTPNSDDFNRIEENIDILGKLDRTSAYGVATGTNSYIVNVEPAPTTYYEGMCISVKIPNQNTGTSTLNVNGLGAKSIKKQNGNNVSAGNLKAGIIYTMRYNGINFILQGEGGEGTAIENDVRLGKTFTNDKGTFTGSLNLNNMVSSNIRDGVNIGGIIGTFKGGWSIVKKEFEFDATYYESDNETIFSVNIPRGAITSVSQIKCFIFIWDRLDLHDTYKNTYVWSEGHLALYINGTYYSEKVPSLCTRSAGYIDARLYNISISGDYIRLYFELYIGFNVWAEVRARECYIMYQL
mgnify:FL=1